MKSRPALRGWITGVIVLLAAGIWIGTTALANSNAASKMYLPLVMHRGQPTVTSTPTEAPTLTPTPTTTPPPGDWLGYLNARRALGGLPAVGENASWSNG